MNKQKIFEIEEKESNRDPNHALDSKLDARIMTAFFNWRKRESTIKTYWNLRFMGSICKVSQGRIVGRLCPLETVLLNQKFVYEIKSFHNFYRESFSSSS